MMKNLNCWRKKKKFESTDVVSDEEMQNLDNRSSSNAPCQVNVVKRVKFSELQIQLMWVFAMTLLGTGDLLIQWWNWKHFTNPDLARGLTVGPPPKILTILLLVFTVVASFLYIPETLNTLSVLKLGGTTKFPIVIEQCIVQLLEAIPLGAVNYFIGRCRCFHGSSSQTAYGSITIVYTFTRLIWYAHLEGKKLIHKEEEANMKKGYFMLCCALFASSMAFPVMIWRASPPELTIEDRLQDVSIMLLKAPFLDNQKLVHYRIDGVLEKQGYNLEYPYLVKSGADILESRPSALSVIFKCDGNTTFLPPECLEPDGHLVFNFTFVGDNMRKPYGEILYNYAFIPPDTPIVLSLPKPTVPDANKNEDNSLGPNVINPNVLKNVTECQPSTHDISGGWVLRYFSLVLISKGKRPPAVYATSPWHCGCTTPRPWYDPITVHMC